MLCLTLHRYPYDNLSTRAKITVQEGRQMVFMSEGMYSDLFLPGGHTISTNNIPFLEKIVTIPFGGESAFKTSLYVVSTKRQPEKAFVLLSVDDCVLPLLGYSLMNEFPAGDLPPHPAATEAARRRNITSTTRPSSASAPTPSPGPAPEYTLSA